LEPFGLTTKGYHNQIGTYLYQYRLGQLREKYVQRHRLPPNSLTPSFSFKRSDSNSIHQALHAQAAVQRDLFTFYGSKRLAKEGFEMDKKKVPISFFFLSFFFFNQINAQKEKQSDLTQNQNDNLSHTAKVLDPASSLSPSEVSRATRFCFWFRGPFPFLQGKPFLSHCPRQKSLLSIPHHHDPRAIHFPKVHFCPFFFFFFLKTNKQKAEQGYTIKPSYCKLI